MVWVMYIHRAGVEIWSGGLGYVHSDLVRWIHGAGVEMIEYVQHAYVVQFILIWVGVVGLK